MSSKNILIILAHPNLEQSRANRRLAQAAAKVEGVKVHDLYAQYPDFKIDVEREQALLLQADVVIFQHPFYWYSSPALLKQWQDVVLTYGFAYGSQGDKLKGKRFFNAISTGGPQEDYQAGGYNHYTISELLRPFQQMANLSGMIYQSPFVISGMLKQSDADLDVAAIRYQERLQDLIGQPNLLAA